MPQVSLYIDKTTLSKIEELAQKSKVSLSKWVGNNLKRLIKDDYPEDFFNLYGSINDTSFEKPKELLLNNDSKRETI